MVIFEDEHILAINKPSGLRTIQDGYDPSLPTVKSLLEPQYGKLWIVHRLDKDTSGILLLARNPLAHKMLNSQFQDRKINKIYHTIVLGTPLWQTKVVDVPLRVNGDRKHRTIQDFVKGKPAQTQFDLLEIYSLFSFLRGIPYTGYTHQIRSHLAILGYPVFGDALYGRQLGDNPPDQPTRLFLHAFSITFFHPAAGTPLLLEAPYPPDWNVLLSQLRKQQ